jgi:type II secretory pathway component PulF
MPVFRYRAVNPAGDVAVGELEAANESEIVDRLRDLGMLPMQVAPTNGGAPARAAGPGRAPAGSANGSRRRRSPAIICWR